MQHSSSKGKNTDGSHIHHHSGRYRTGAEVTNTATKSSVASKITSPNRFEKLDPDGEHESGLATLSISSLSSSSSSNTSLKTSGEEKKAGKDRSGSKTGKGGSYRKGSSRSQQQEQSSVVAAGTKSAGHGKEDPVTNEDGSQQKKKKQIKFSLPADGEAASVESGSLEAVSEQASTSGGSATAAAGFSDKGASSSEEGTSPSEKTSEHKGPRLIYTRVCYWVTKEEEKIVRYTHAGVFADIEGSSLLHDHAF